MVNTGYVAPSYVAGMLEREQVLSTYLGNGIALPQGRSVNLQAVHNTGISVLQLPQGVYWEAGERVYLVMGLAAKPNEHTTILANLVEILQDAESSQQHAHIADQLMIIQRLTRIG